MIRKHGILNNKSYLGKGQKWVHERLRQYDSWASPWRIKGVPQHVILVKYILHQSFLLSSTTSHYHNRNMAMNLFKSQRLIEFFYYHSIEKFTKLTKENNSHILDRKQEVMSLRESGESW